MCSSDLQRGVVVASVPYQLRSAGHGHENGHGAPVAPGTKPAAAPPLQETR